MDCGCTNTTLSPFPSLTKICDPCVENTNCYIKMDADCVFYHFLDNKPSKLLNLGIENKTSVSDILEALDTLVGNNFNTPISGQNTASVNITTSGVSGHTIKADVKISSQNGNALVISNDGLFVTTSQSDGKLKINASDLPDYLENQLGGGTDGVVSISTVTQDGQVTIQPSLSIPQLIDKIRTDYYDLFSQLIYTYISSQQVYQKLAPYVAYEYYGSLNNFDASGKGIAAKGYDKVYICNGLNGTPDKRGRVAVGANVGVPGGALNSSVSPIVHPSFAISLNTLLGEFEHPLTSNENGQHTHATIVAPHSHILFSQGTSLSTLNTSSQYVSKQAAVGGNSSYDLQGTNTPPSVGKTNDVSQSVIVNNSGLGTPHNNVQPSIGAIYYMYIP